MTDMNPSGEEVLTRIADVLETRLPSKGGDPAQSYVAKLFSKGPDAALKKVGEESTELVMAVKVGVKDKIIAETADLWFHCLVVLTEHGIRPEAVLAELARREGISGIAEKASRKT
jgi:phosphoribosyl-ATP pyrophosphohydrolase